MAYIVERNNRFYIVAYDGIDPLSGRERRRWHPAGRSRADTEAIVTTLAAKTLPPPDVSTSPLTFGKFLSEQWMSRRRPRLGASTAHLYQWMIDNDINQRICDIPIRALRVEHIDHLYRELLEHGSRTGGALANKTVYDVHVIVRSSLADATRRVLVATDVALVALAPRAQPRARCGLEIWTAAQVGGYLGSAAHCGSSRHCISLRSPGCGAVNSPVSAGATGNATGIASSSRAVDGLLWGDRWKCPSRPARVGKQCVESPVLSDGLRRARRTPCRPRL